MPFFLCSLEKYLHTASSMEEGVTKDLSDVEQDVVKDLEICRQERDILKEKLHVHLDRWTLDKIVFNDMAAKSEQELRTVLAAHAYEMSRKDMLIRSQEQKLLVLKHKLDSALEDSELTEFQLSAVTSQWHETMKWLHSSNQKRLELEEKMPLKVESRSRKLMKERDRRISQLERLLDGKQRSHALELEETRKKQTLKIAELKELMESQDNKRKAQQAQWSLERKELMAAAQESDDLRTEKEKWSLEQKEMQEAITKHDLLLESRTKEVIKERDLLKLEKEDWVKTEKSLAMLVKDRDDLMHKVEGLGREQNVLQRKLALNVAQREEEVKALVRERDFVWSQMKRVEENYKERVQKLQAETLAKKQENENLRCELEREKSNINDRMVEMAIAKLEGQQAADLANKRESELKANLQELQSRLEMYGRRTEVAPADQNRPIDRPPEAEPSRRQGGGSCHRNEEETTADARNEGPEVLDDDGNQLDQDIPESQVDQDLEVDRNKTLEELQRENGNLRRETENLKALYADLEDAQRRKRQKTGKGGNKANSRDATIRNLKGELEAAAASGRPPKKDSTAVRNSGNSTKSKSGSIGGASKHNANKENAGHYQSDQADMRSLSLSEPLTSTQRVTRSSAKATAGVVLPQTLRTEERESNPHDENLSSDGAWELHETEPARKKLKVKNTRDASQRDRLPLSALPHNRKSSSKPPTRLSSLANGPLSKSESKASLGSPNQTSKMMANLFSTAFSVPKLKHAQTPAGRS